MSSLIKFLRHLFVYQEPKSEELGFELLETPSEGTDEVSREPLQSSPPETEKPRTGNRRSGRKPIFIGEWNQSRLKENMTQTNSNEDNISADLQTNRKIISQRFNIPKNQDFVIREFKVGRQLDAFIVYIDGMVDKQVLNLSLFPQLMAEDCLKNAEKNCPIDFLMGNILSMHGITKETRYQSIIKQILSGVSALFMEGCTECILIEARGYEKRNVDSPKTETVVKGAQEGFTENLRTNISLIRRLVRNEKLMTEMFSVGSMNNLNCAILYMDGVADTRVVQEVKKRINSIRADLIIGDGMVEQFIEDNPFMLFPQVISTERPDRTASFITEGQVVIITEGTPFSMAVPVTFFRLLHTSEDTFTRWPFGTFLRLIRLLGLFCATLLPGLYTAVIMFHPETIPTELLASVVKAKESVPFPTILEVLVMELAFELIREGGIRVPTVIGQTLGIVGALILGEAAVSAGLVSPLLVIVVAVTALGSFAIPNYSMALAIRIERFFFIFAGAFLGFYGIALVFILLASVSCSMKSFGVPYFAPVAPRTKINPDLLTRGHIWAQKKRPDALQTPYRKRQGENQESWIRSKGPGQKGAENRDDKGR